MKSIRKAIKIEQNGILGFCSRHPKIPAIATEKYKNQTTRFCKDCWLEHKYKTLNLKETKFEGR
jgi:hypothetical protein